MKQNIIYVGLNVDAHQYHGSALDKKTGEIITFKCRPTLKGLLNQLDGLHKCFPESAFKLCYEASYIGYTLQRDLVEKGYHCDVVAPASIPSPRGKQVKTDRIDAAQLVQSYANDLLTLVTIAAGRAGAMSTSPSGLTSQFTKRPCRCSCTKPALRSTERCWDMTGWLISMPSRNPLAFMPPVASFSKIARRIGSAKALKISFSITASHMYTLI